LGKKDYLRLLSSRKLALIVDLDQTLVHTSMDPNIEPGLPVSVLGKGSWVMMMGCEPICLLVGWGQCDRLPPIWWGEMLQF